MNRISRSTRLLSIAVILGLFSLSIPGCVSSSTYKAAKKEAEDLRHELQQERLKVVAVEKMHAQRIKQMEDLANRFGSSVQRLEEVAKNWGDLRNELIRLRINRELQRQRGEGGIGIVLDNDSITAPSGK